MKRMFLYSFIFLSRLVADIPLVGMFYFLHFQKEGTGESLDAIINGFMFVSFAALHSTLARKFARKQIARLVGEEHVRILYVYIASFSLALLLYLWRPLSGGVWRTEGVLFWTLSLLYLGCIVGMILTATHIDYLDFLGLRTIWRKLNDRPARASEFSVKGLYAHCRHPMYFFLLGAFWTAPVMTFGRLEFACLGTLYVLIGTVFEEQNLCEELGEIYDVYRTNVPMWIPRLKPWKHNITNTGQQSSVHRDAVQILTNSRKD